MIRNAKTLYTILLLSVLGNHSNVAYLLTLQSVSDETLAANCGCSTEICCCTGLGNPAVASMCGAKVFAPERKGDRAGAAIESCATGHKPVLPGLKQVLPLAGQAQIVHYQHHSRTNFLQKVHPDSELAKRIDRPPRF